MASHDPVQERYFPSQTPLMPRFVILPVIACLVNFGQVPAWWNENPRSMSLKRLILIACSLPAQLTQNPVYLIDQQFRPCDDKRMSDVWMMHIAIPTRQPQLRSP